MDNPVAYRDDLTPGHFRVAVCQFRGQTIDRLANDSQVVEDGCGQYCVFEK
jgi:hypothetical protein